MTSDEQTTVTVGWTRRKDGGLPKRAAELREQGRRRRGRPRLRWEERRKTGRRRHKTEEGGKHYHNYEAVKKLRAAPHP